MRRINKIKLFTNEDIKSKEIANKIISELKDNAFEITTNNDFDLGISIGGDGSFLKMIRSDTFNDSHYYIGVNSGTLGFLQEIDYNETSNFIDKLVNNDYKLEELNYLETIVYCNNSIIKYYGLNEVVLRKGNLSVLKGQLFVDNELLENFTGDGLLISTSTGSTAYNMSFGGSIIYNTLKAYIITPIAPINNKAYNTLTNSLVIPHEKIITLSLNGDSLLLMIDGQNKILNDVMKVEIKISENKIKCLRMNDFHFIKVINKKIIEK